MSRPRPWSSLTVWFSFWLANLSGAGCSLLIDGSAIQCENATDCARFTGTTCDGTRYVCVPSVGNGNDASSVGGPQNIDPSGMPPGTLTCPPDGSTAPGLELLNSCTDSTCVPFDNRARLANLASDGTLKPLPDLSGVQP